MVCLDCGFSDGVWGEPCEWTPSSRLYTGTGPRLAYEPSWNASSECTGPRWMHPKNPFERKLLGILQCSKYDYSIFGKSFRTYLLKKVQINDNKYNINKK